MATMKCTARRLDLRLANDSENTVHLFLARDVNERSSRTGFEMAVDRIVAGIEAQTAYRIGMPYPVVGGARYRRFLKR